MAMIKRADFEQYARDAYVMDLSDLEKRGRAVVDAANAQAEQILRQAQAKRDQMLATASQEGHEQGFEKGLSEGREEGIRQGTEEARAQHGEQLAQLLTLWTEQLDAFELQRDTMLEQARVQVVELAAMVARRVVRRAVDLNPGVVLMQVEAVLSSVTESTRLVLTVHPDDAEFVRSELPGMVDRFAGCEHAQVMTDASLLRGS
ncbi:MAG: FliH/SctL family protein [Phycisphaerales bacterium]